MCTPGSHVRSDREYPCRSKTHRAWKYLFRIDDPDILLQRPARSNGNIHDITIASTAISIFVATYIKDDLS